MTPERHLPRSPSTGILARVVLVRGAVVRRAVVLVLVGVLSLAACGGDEDDAAGTSAASATAPASEPVVIPATLTVAAEEGSEPIATGTVLEGSTLGGTPSFSFPSSPSGIQFQCAGTETTVTASPANVNEPCRLPTD